MPKLINCGGCFQRHERPSCLLKGPRRPTVTSTKPDTIESKMAAGGLTDDESAHFFGQDWEDGNVPERGTPEYLTYVEVRLRAQEKTHAQQVLDFKTQEAENKLRRLSLSPLKPGHSQLGTTGSHDTDAEACGVSSLADKLCKLRPEYYCDPTKSYEKMSFRELVRGCTRVLSFLRASKTNVDGYLSHLNFILDKASMGVYTTEGLVLYERNVTTKVLDGVILDWPEVDSACDSRYLSYEYTFDHLAKSDRHDKQSRHSRRKTARKSSSLLYDFELWDKNSPDICWLWNVRKCEGCERKHGICGLCHESHRAADCDQSTSVAIQQNRWPASDMAARGRR